MRVVPVHMLQQLMDAGNFSMFMFAFGHGKLLLQFPELPIAIDYVFDRINIAKISFLRHMRDSQARWNMNIAAILSEFTEQQPEQAGFTGSICAGDANMLTGMNCQSGIFQQRASAALQAD